MLEMILILIGLAVLGTPLISLGLSLKLRKRVEIIEGQLSGNIPRAVSSQSVDNQTLSDQKEKDKLAGINSRVVEPEAEVAFEEESAWFGSLVGWLKEEWLLKLGALLFIIGLGWFVTYAFINNWIGPRGRIGFGIMLGVLVLLFGWWRIKRYLYQGGIFLVLGSTIILMTILAARQVYQMFTPVVALAIMFLSTVFVALASVKYKVRSLSLISLILAGVAPLLINVASSDFISIFAYLFVVSIGAIWIVALTGRRELVLSALILIILYSMPHLVSKTGADKDVLLLFAYAFAALFFLTNVLAIIKSKSKELSIDLITAAGNGLLLLAWIMVAGQKEWQSLIISAWMVVFAVGAFVVFKISGRKEPFFAYAGVGVVMLAVATSAELKGAALAIAYALEGGLISFIIYGALKDIRIAEKVSLLLFAPILLSFKSIGSNAWAHSILHKDFFALFILGFILFISGQFFWRKDRENNKLYSIRAALIVFGSIYFYVILWLSLHVKLTDYLAVMISLTIYTIIGLINYFYGTIYINKYLRIYGAALLVFVVVRLLIVDVWQMELTGRIITFCLVGVLLISTAFLGRIKKADRLNQPNENI